MPGYIPRATLGVLVVLFGASGCADSSGGAWKKPDRLELEYRALALSMGSMKPCLLISPKSMEFAAFNAPGTRYAWLRSTCFFEVAVNTRDAALCERAIPVPPEIEEKTSTNPARCRELAKGGRVYHSGSPNLKVLLQKMGYSNDEIQARLRQRRDELVRSAEFFNRIQRLPNFGGPESAKELDAIAWRPQPDRSASRASIDCPGERNETGGCFIGGPARRQRPGSTGVIDE